MAGVSVESVVDPTRTFAGVQYLRVRLQEHGCFIPLDGFAQQDGRCSAITLDYRRLCLEGKVDCGGRRRCS